MAENQIKAEELIQPDVFKDLRDSAAASLPVMKEMSAVLQSFLLLTKETLKNNPLGSAEDVNGIGDSYRKVKPAADAYMRVQAQIETAQKKINETLEQNYDELQKNKLAISEVTRETKNYVKAQVAEEGSLDQLRAKLNLATQAYTALSETVRKSNVGLKQLSGIETLRLKIDEVEHSMGNFQRNVGNYKSGYNGLAQSINQLTREAPAAAVSMSTFFLAISNNIPQFTDEIKKLKTANVELAKSGEPVVSIAGAIAKAFFSWQTLISVGITLLTVYGSKMIEWVTNTDKATKSQFDFNEELKKSEANIENLTRKIEDAQIRIRVASGTMTKEAAEAFKIDREGNQDKKDAYEIFIAQEKKLREELAKTRGEEKVSQQLIDAQTRGRSQSGFKMGTGFYEYFKGLDKAAQEMQTAMFLAQQKRDREQDAKRLEDQKAAADKHKKQLEHTTKQEEETLEQYYQRLLKDTEIFYEREQIANDEAYMKNEIGTQEHNDRKEDLTIEALKIMLGYAEKYGFDTLEFEKRLNDLQLAQYEKYLKERKDLAEKEGNDPLSGGKGGKDAARIAGGIKSEAELDKAIKDRIQREKDLYAALQNESNQHYDNELKNIDRQIAAHQKEQDTLRILAAQGVDNAKESLAAEQKAQAEAEEKRAETLRKKQKAEFALTVLKLETANLEANPDNPGKATLDTIAQAAALVSLIEGLPSFFVGTEDTGHGGGLDGKGGFLAINHPHERIVPAHQNLLFGGVSNDEAAKVMSLYNSNQLAPVAYSHDSRDIVRELKNVRETIKTEKSNTFFDYDRITDSFIRVTESKTKLTIDRTKNGGIW